MNKFFDTIWTNLQSTKARETSYAVTVDSLGFVYVGGYTLGDLNGDLNKGGADGFIAKYSADGALIWSHLLGSSGGDAVSGISSDKYNNVYVFVGLDSRYEPDPVPAAGVSAKTHKLIKFDSTGSELASISVTTEPMNSSGLMWFDLVGRGISANSEGDVFITGSDGMWHKTYGAYFSKEFIDSNGDPSKGLTWENKNWFPSAANSFNTVVFSDNSVFAAGRADGDQAFLTKYSVDSTIDWTRTITSSSYGEINAIAADSAGGIYVVGIAGEIQGAGYTPGKVVINAASPPSQLELIQNGVASADAFIAKFDSNGNQLWVKQFGTEGDDSANSVTVDIYGNIYVGGFSGRTYGNTAVTNTDARPFIKVFDSAGNISWEKNFDDANGDTYAMCADSKGFIYAAGMTQGDLNGVTSESDSGRNGFLMKLAYLTGSSSDDELEGSSGNDEIYALDGNDSVNSGAGDDFIIGGAGEGDDTYDGGTGIDTVKYTSALAGIKVNLSPTTGTATSIAARDASRIGNDKLTNIENIIAGNFNDNLTGSAAANVIKGGKGKDTIDGGLGSDTADYSDKSSAISVKLTGVTAATVKVNNIAEDTIKNIENIIGGSGNDSLAGDVLANSLFGGNGNDVLTGGAGNDAINGDDGVDTASFSDKTISVMITLSAGAGTATIGTETDTLTDIENLTGGSGNDALTGDDDNNVLAGGAGIDTLIGGAGIDTLDGGDGIDTADFSDKTTAVVATLKGATQITVTVGGAAEDKLANIENIIGGSGNDSLTGDGLANTLMGGAGNDTLNGGAGIDTADYSDKISAVSVTLNGAFDAVVNVDSVAEDTIKNIENIIAGSGNDTLTGDSLANVLNGGGGDDTLKGAAGIDTLNGGAGSDTADFSDKTTSVLAVLNGSTQITVTVGRAADDKLVNIENLLGGSANDTLTGDALANVLVGNAGNDTLNGAAGSDTLNGGSGNDLLTGGAGNDVINGGDNVDTASFVDKTARVVITLSAGSGTATIDSETDTLTGIENLTGGSGNDSLTGDENDNFLIGGAGNDSLNGGSGIDTLTGGTGDDQFIFNTALNGLTNVDTITDFKRGGDKLVLDDAIFAQLTAGVTAGNIVVGTTAVLASYSFDAYDYLMFNTTTKTLFYDATGSGGNDAIAFMQLTGVSTLTQSDFSII